MLALEGAPHLPGLATAFRGSVHWAAGPREAAEALATLHPSVILIDGGIAWQRAFVLGVAPERRPAVIAVGGEYAMSAAVADEWLSAGRDRVEAALRLKLALERARARRQIARRAFVDFLTGLPNRRATVRALVREAERVRRVGGSLSLVLIDLDDFKAVNERGGHPAGDRVLRRVGAVLRRVTRGSEACGRVGGDEFALVISGGLGLARGAVRRVTDSLLAAGIRASAAACELRPSERLRELYRRTDRELKAVKTLAKAQALVDAEQLREARTAADS